MPSMLDLPIDTVALTGVQDASVRLGRCPIGKSLSKSINQLWRSFSESVCHAFWRTEFSAIEICRTACAYKVARAKNACYGSSWHISHYIHLGLNGQDDRLARFDFARRVLA